MYLVFNLFVRNCSVIVARSFCLSANTFTVEFSVFSMEKRFSLLGFLCALQQKFDLLGSRCCLFRKTVSVKFLVVLVEEGASLCVLITLVSKKRSFFALFSLCYCKTTGTPGLYFQSAKGSSARSSMRLSAELISALFRPPRCLAKQEDLEFA